MAKTISPLKLSFKSAVWTQNKSNHSRSGHPWRPGFDGRVYLPILDRALKAGAMVSHCERWRNMPCVTTFSGWRWDERLPAEISSSIHPFFICSKNKLHGTKNRSSFTDHLPTRRPIHLPWVRVWSQLLRRFWRPRVFTVGKPHRPRRNQCASTKGQVAAENFGTMTWG